MRTDFRERALRPRAVALALPRSRHRSSCGLVHSAVARGGARANSARVPLESASPRESSPPEDRGAGAPGSAAQAADLLALGRAALEAITRAVRTAPEVRSARVMTRWPLDLEELLLELEPMQAETPLGALALRLGVPSAQLRATALKLQRLGLVRVTEEGIAVTAQGRHRLARLEEAQATVLRRVAQHLGGMSNDDGRRLLEQLRAVIEAAEAMVDEHAAAPRARPPSGAGRRSPSAARLGEIGGGAGSAR
jgi:hypothetical protein